LARDVFAQLHHLQIKAIPWVLNWQHHFAHSERIRSIFIEVGHSTVGRDQRRAFHVNTFAFELPRQDTELSAHYRTKHATAPCAVSYQLDHCMKRFSETVFLQPSCNRSNNAATITLNGFKMTRYEKLNWAVLNRRTKRYVLFMAERLRLPFQNRLETVHRKIP
jgi:hypothetical protein